jgi:hypothetical protein
MSGTNLSLGPGSCPRDALQVWARRLRDALQACSAQRSWSVREVDARLSDRVEGEQWRRRTRRCSGSIAGRKVKACLQRAEVGPTLGVGNHDLAVGNGPDWQSYGMRW